MLSIYIGHKKRLTQRSAKAIFARFGSKNNHDLERSKQFLEERKRHANPSSQNRDLTRKKLFFNVGKHRVCQHSLPFNVLVTAKKSLKTTQFRCKKTHSKNKSAIAPKRQ